MHGLMEYIYMMLHRKQKRLPASNLFYLIVNIFTSLAYGG